MTQSPKNGSFVDVLERSEKLLQNGRSNEAVDLMEAALKEVHQGRRGLPFLERVDLGMALAELYLMNNQRERARSLLANEAAYAEQIWRLVQRRGTREQIRDAVVGRGQLVERAAQVALIGQPAPELELAEWILGEPTTLAQQRDRVVLLDFWSYTCRPCLAAFPVLNELHTRYQQSGLTILALTRYVRVPSADPSVEQARQRAAITQTLGGRGLEFPVGIAPDARIQERYGAMGVPVFYVIDRQGIVQVISSTDDKSELESTIQDLLGELRDDE